MKIFVPLCDSQMLGGSTSQGQLVPFSPDMLTEAMLKAESALESAEIKARDVLNTGTTHRTGRSKEGFKPRNWVPDTDYTEACERLAADMALA